MKKADNKTAIIKPKVHDNLLEDICALIDKARESVAITVNSSLTQLYWSIGNRINKEILREKRADYGKQILATLSQELSDYYGKGFSYSALTRMVKFVGAFPDKKIVATMSQKLSWSHFIELIKMDDELQRTFYSEMCRIEGWSVRILRKKIDSMLFERTALSKKPEELAKKELELLRNEGRMSPDLVFRDPYFLDFLGLRDIWLEKDLETAILHEMESFILELGVGFAFLARQKRIIVDDKDYYIDLLFYHRFLHRLVVVELKLGEFKPEHKGQMELYLRYLDKYERQLNEEHPIGLILCAGKSSETIELLDLKKSGIRVASYLTELLPKEQLEKKLHEAVSIARRKIEIGKE